MGEDYIGILGIHTWNSNSFLGELDLWQLSEYTYEHSYGGHKLPVCDHWLNPTMNIDCQQCIPEIIEIIASR